VFIVFSIAYGIALILALPGKPGTGSFAIGLPSPWATSPDAMVRIVGVQHCTLLNAVAVFLDILVMEWFLHIIDARGA
jgi:hypothetical protein